MPTLLKLQTSILFTCSDGSGSIDPEEFGQMLKSLGHSISKVDMDKVIKDMDTDGDGTINFMEFLNRAPDWLINSVMNSSSLNSPKLGHVERRKAKVNNDQLQVLITTFQDIDKVCIRTIANDS